MKSSTISMISAATMLLTPLAVNHAQTTPQEVTPGMRFLDPNGGIITVQPGTTILANICFGSDGRTPTCHVSPILPGEAGKVFETKEACEAAKEATFTTWLNLVGPTWTLDKKEDGGYATKSSHAYDGYKGQYELSYEINMLGCAPNVSLGDLDDGEADGDSPHAPNPSAKTMPRQNLGI